MRSKPMYWTTDTDTQALDAMMLHTSDEEASARPPPPAGAGSKGPVVPKATTKVVPLETTASPPPPQLQVVQQSASGSAVIENPRENNRLGLKQWLFAPNRPVNGQHGLFGALDGLFAHYSRLSWAVLAGDSCRVAVEELRTSVQASIADGYREAERGALAG